MQFKKRRKKAPTKTCAVKHVKTAEILKSFCPSQVFNIHNQEEVDFFMFSGVTLHLVSCPGLLHWWQRNKSDMCWTIHRSQGVIATFLSDPRSTFIFSRWVSLLCLSAYAVEIKVRNNGNNIPSASSSAESSAL